jgi:hypothetical protein
MAFYDKQGPPTERETLPTPHATTTSAAPQSASGLSEPTSQMVCFKTFNHFPDDMID